MKKSQTTSHIMMVRPANFGYNEQTAITNAFQQQATEKTQAEIKQLAKQEFDDFVATLRRAGVNVHVIEDTESPLKPDAVFPNNWVTFHTNGTVITYPMYAPTRRIERSEDILTQLTDRFEISRRVKLEDYEDQDKYLEGTGSMILDRINRNVYACVSARTDIDLLEDFCQWADYKKVLFRATDAEGQEIYHTNVMMAMGTTFVVICLDTVRNEAERANLVHLFKKTNKTIIEISMKQMMAFAGNMLQVNNDQGESFLVMSEQAYLSLSTSQINTIQTHTNILYSPLYTIEKFGGGSARCMMAEIFLPQKATT